MIDLSIKCRQFRSPRSGPVSTPSGGERAGQGKESLEVDVADELKLNVYHALLAMS